jgi:hypothetical protein
MKIILKELKDIFCLSQQCIHIVALCGDQQGYQRICIMEIKLDKIMISVYGMIEVETILTQQYTVYYAAYITKINKILKL